MKTFVSILVFFPLLASAGLNWSIGDGFFIPGVNDSSFISDPETGNLVPVGSAVYLIYDSDGDGSAGDIDLATGLPINGDVLVSSTTSYAIGDGGGFAGGITRAGSGGTSFADLNAALNGEMMGLFYVRVLNKPDPVSPVYYYGDSIDPNLGGNTTQADENNNSGGYFKYTETPADSPLQPAWTLPVIQLQRVPEPSTMAMFGLGLLGLFVWRRRNNA